MAMTTCRECGHQISTTAKACPSCGAEHKSRTPVRTGLAVFAAAGFGLAAAVVAGTVFIMNGHESAAVPMSLAFLAGAAVGWFRVMR